MIKKNAIRLASVGIIAGALIGATSLTAQAAPGVPPAPVGSTGAYYLVDSGTGEPVLAGTVLNYNTDVSGSPVVGAANDFANYFTGPADATGVKVFVAAVGTERNTNTYSSWAPSAFADPVAKTVLLPAGELDAMINGLPGQASVKAAGGNYSLGVAFTKDNGVNIASGAVYYTTISIEAGTGLWTPYVTGVVTPPPPASGTFDQNLSATTIAAQDGTLNLVAPASSTTTLGAATLVNQLSTSTGDLGKFTVQDTRVVTAKGWDLTTSVTNFTNTADSTKTIDKKQLGVAAKAAAGTTLPAGVTLAAAQVAGSAVNPAPFASAAAGTAIAATDLDAGLTLVAPANTPAGTYTAKLTVTLASK
ncbi:hypothetical protein [Subtercola frigoramans]|uniref:WxL domain-containing protein n=1 Tax=Subtercola frigoramans TaxID=120298 RepID=A0ABS2L6V5_9MICO|nr:hypothetical protein [Subtercola frigoramans]MBM7472216.1 hypothetical protein [Subtercola frigoramans]